ncbi:MAG: hypothetical protein WCO60_07005 [Verrucomicrobiota bacterium]
MDIIKDGVVAAKKRAVEIYDSLARQIRLPPIPHPFPTKVPPEDEGCVLVVPQVFQADFFSCGAIAGWTVLKAVYPKKGRAEHIAFYESCNPCPKNGTSTTRLVKALRAHDVRVSLRRKKATFAEIKKAMDAGSPIIACIDMPGTGCYHWVTIYGYRQVSKKNGGDKWVYISNNGWPILGAIDDRVMPFERFKELQVDQWLVCTGKQ